MSPPHHEVEEASPLLVKPSWKLLLFGSPKEVQFLRGSNTHAGSNQFNMTRAARWRLFRLITAKYRVKGDQAQLLTTAGGV